jgi:hypothetical protein
MHGAKNTAPIAAYYRSTQHTAVKAKDAMPINYSKMGIKTTEISACSHCAGMAMLFGWIAGGIAMP